MAHERVYMNTEAVEENDAENEKNSEKEEGGKCQACASCARIHKYVSKWMLPEDARDTYLERANCIPPPIFIICISVAEVSQPGAGEYFTTALGIYIRYNTGDQELQCRHSLKSTLMYLMDRDHWTPGKDLSIGGSVEVNRHVIGDGPTYQTMKLLQKLQDKAIAWYRFYPSEEGHLGTDQLDNRRTRVLAIFIYYAVWMPQKQWITLDNGVWSSPYIYRPDKREEAWRFLSYMLVHAGIQHILGNLILQLVFGIPLEMVHKGHRVGLVYLSGVIAGSLASSIFDPLYALVGASGGVYALMGGYFMNVLVNFGEMVPLFGIFRLLAITLIVGTDVGFALYRRFISRAAGPAVSFVAHIGGGLAGMTIGYVVFSSFDKNLIKDPRFWICIAAYVVCVIFAVFFNIFLSPAS